MLIGDKSLFCIECDVCDRFAGFVYCNFRFWLGGAPVGNWDEECVLGVLIQSADVFLKYQGNRHLAVADTVKSSMLWDHISEFTESGCADALSIGIEAHYRQRFLLHTIADDSVATMAHVVVVERADMVQRLLWCKHDDKIVNELLLEKGTVDGVIAKFLAWADDA